MEVNSESIKMKAKQNAYNTLSCLTWLLKVFSLNSNAEHNINTTILLIKSALTAIVLTTLTFCCLYYNVLNIYNTINISIKLTEVVQMVYDICQYSVDLVFVNKYGTRISVEYFKQYDNIDKILGFKNYSSLRRRLVKLVIFFTSLWLISTSCHLVVLTIGYGWVTSTINSVIYIYLYIKILTTLDLTSHVMNIEMRLKAIGDFVQNYYLTAEPYPGTIGDSILCNQNWLHTKESSRISALHERNNPSKLISFNNHHEVKWLTRCYLMLSEQVTFINTMYGIRILLNSLSLLIDMVRFTNIAVRLLIESQEFIYKSGVFAAIFSVMRLLTCVAVLISLVTHCEQTYSQRDRIIRITDHLLINKNPDDELRSGISELRQLMKDRPITYNMANFFILNYSFLMSTASVVVTYTIILLQSIK